MINFGIFIVSGCVWLVGVILILLSNFFSKKVGGKSDPELPKFIDKMSKLGFYTLTFMVILFTVVLFAFNPIARNVSQTDLGYGQVVEKVVTTKEAAVDGAKAIKLKKEEALSEINKVEDESAAAYNEFIKKFKKGDK